MANVSTWVKDWDLASDDPLCLRPYVLASDDLFIPTSDKFQTVRVFRGPPTDRIRLDVTSASVPSGGGTPHIFLRVTAIAGCQSPGLLGANGQWVVNVADPVGGLVQVSGLLTDAWMLEAFTDIAVWNASTPIKLGMRALVDRVGGPFEVVRGLLLP